MDRGGLMTHKQRTMDEYKEAITSERGIVTAIARKLDLSHQAVRAKMKNHPELKELLNESRDGLIDDAENVIANHIAANNLNAAIFALKTVGKVRGWGESQEIIVSKGKDENYDLSVLTPEERILLDELTAKIYHTEDIETKVIDG